MLTAVSINSGATLTQNFDSLANTGTGVTWSNTTPTLAGWELYTTAGAAITTYSAGTGSSATAGNYSFGVAGTNALTDRALGSLADNGFAGYMAFGVTNNTGNSVTGFTINFDGEQWRVVNSAAQTLTLEYGFGASFSAVTTWTAPGGAFNFTTPQVSQSPAAPLDGNAVANRTAGLGGTITTPWANNTTLWIRWADANDSGTDHALAIDNVSFTIPNQAPTAVSLLNTTTSLAEDTSTASNIKVADISVTDDGKGTNTLSLTGADASSFVIVGTELFLKAGTTLDFETKTSYAVTVNVDDTAVGSTPDLTTNFNLSITNVRELLVVQSGGTTSVSENGSSAQKQDSFTVALDTAPTTNVVVTVSSGDTTEATVSTSQLTFTNANWNVAQTVTVSGVYDNIADGNQPAVITVSVNDGLSDDAFDAVLDQTVTATVVDIPNRPVVTGPTGENNPAFPTITWNDVTGETSYSLWLINKGTGALVLSKDGIAANATSYTITNSDVPGGLPAADYRFWLFSVSANGYSTPGTFTDFAVGAAAVTPTAPTVTGTSDSGFGANRPQINWNTVSGATTYGVYLMSLSTNSAVASQSGLTATNFTPASGLADGKYRIWVNATNAAGTSVWSTPFDFDVGTPITTPVAPTVTGTSNSGFGANRPQINWNAVSGAATYGVYLINLETSAVISTTTGLATNSFTPASNLADGRYRIWVNATNIAGTSPWSTPFDFSVGNVPTTPPTAPTGFAVNNPNSSTPTITWTSGFAGTKYEIWLVNLDTNTMAASQTGLTQAAFTPSSPLANGRYRLFVRAYNSVGSSGWSNPFDFIISV